MIIQQNTLTYQLSMIYEIRRGTEIVWSGKAEGKQSRVIMQADMVEVTIKSPVAIAFQKGDTIQVYGETYKLNRPENIAKQNTQIGYTYTVEFEALYYDLGKWILYTLDGSNKLTQPDVYLQGEARTILGLLVQNANRASSGWSLGIVDDTDVIQWTYSSAKLLTVLQDIADQTNLEFWVDGKTINLTRRQNDTGLSLAYGKGKGLYELNRARREDPIVTHLTVAGGSQNIPNSYGYRNIQPTGGNPMVNPAYQDGQDRVESVIVFENIYPRLNAKVTTTSAINIIRSTDLDFDLNDHLLDDGTSAQIAFTSGLLNGFTFTIAKDGYTHANKQILFNAITDDNAYPQGIPNEQLKPSVGDTFVLLNIDMPQSYVDHAEARVKELGDQYFTEEGVEQYDWTGKLTPKFVLENKVELKLGGLVELRAEDIGFTGIIRVDSYTRDLQQEHLYDFTLSNIITINKLVRERNMSDRLANTVSKGISQDGLSTKATFAERAGYAATAGHATTATTAATALRADHATNADNAIRAQKADVADYALDSDKWDGKEFADYLDQPVRANDAPVFAGISSPSFASGFFGHGYRISKDTNGKYMAEFDRLTVRQDFNVYELIVNQLRATNGSLIVSDGIKITGATQSGTNYICTIDTDGGTIGVPFRVDDILQTQVYNGSSMKYYVARVLQVGSGDFAINIIDGASIPAEGDDLVRIDNFTDANRKGIVYITASDSGAPYIDTAYGKWTNPQSSVRVRNGRLNGIVSQAHGALSGYGIYGNNAYFENGFFEGTLKVRAGSNSNIYTKGETDGVINAIDIGGRNLMRNTSKFVNTDFWISNGGGLSIAGVFDVNTTSSTALRTSLPSGAYYTEPIKLKCNTEYTISAYVVTAQSFMGDANVPLHIWLGTSPNTSNLGYTTTGFDQDLTSQRWKKCWKTFKTGGNTGEFCYLRPHIYAGRGSGFIYFSEVILTEGNKVVAWTPSPDDVTSNIEAVRYESNAQFSVLNTAISQKVSQTDFNALGVRVGTTESGITNLSGEIRAQSSRVDNVTGRITAAEAKVTPSEINLTVSSQIDTKVRIKTKGRMLDGLRNPYFERGQGVDTNGLSVYDNANTGTVSIVNEQTGLDAQPTNRPNRLKVIHSGAGQSPNFGGVKWEFIPIVGASYHCKITALIPAGRSINFHSNSLGTGGSHSWLTSNAGTGKWEEYIYSINVGQGAIGSSGYFSISGGSAPTTQSPLLWYICYATVVNINQTEDDVSRGEIRAGLSIVQDGITFFGQTFSFKGKLTAEAIEANTVFAQSMTATDLTVSGNSRVGGFTIDGNKLKNSNSDTSLVFERLSNSAETWLRINENDSWPVLAIRTDQTNRSGISVSTYATGATGINILSNLGGTAIYSSGTHEFIQRSGDLWNAPGVLLAMRISVLGHNTQNVLDRWTTRGINSNPTWIANYTWRILHNIGHTDYVPLANHIFTNGGGAGSIVITEKTATTITFQCWQVGVVNIQLIGRNKIV